MLKDFVLYKFSYRSALSQTRFVNKTISRKSSLCSNGFSIVRFNFRARFLGVRAGPDLLRFRGDFCRLSARAHRRRLVPVQWGLHRDQRRRFRQPIRHRYELCHTNLHYDRSLGFINRKRKSNTMVWRRRIWGKGRQSIFIEVLTLGRQTKITSGAADCGKFAATQKDL